MGRSVGVRPLKGPGIACGRVCVYVGGGGGVLEDLCHLRLFWGRGAMGQFQNDPVG